MYPRLCLQQTRFVYRPTFSISLFIIHIYNTPVQLCSVLADYKEGYSALKREGWDISHYTRAAKDTGYSIEFEPRGITTKDFRTSGHNKSSKKRKEKNYSKSSTSLADRTGLELVSRSVVQCSSNVF